ncbi:SapC family protein [Qipengyuania flava]|uniref:SapC family protein n=1 Tax=Qipengyuania flava TaxID=192812 RepID=UPI001C62F70E|nr:SapC family protein [Qipengyuania flava]QYJ06795.1 SapC family protein [Qipengyuania flava]
MSNHQILNTADHAELRVHTHASAEFGDTAMAALIVPEEFRQVQAHYPIVFRRDAASGKFVALALFGFENGENLFLDGDVWDARYRPLSIAIQPFLVGRAPDGEGEGQVHIDMGHPRVSTSGEGTRVFDEHGQSTPFLEDITRKLGALHVGYQASGDFYDALARYELLEPFTFEVPLSNGSTHSLVGFHMINEDKLRTLDGEALGALHAEEHLMPIFMALASVSNLTDLVARKDAKENRG